MEVILKEDVVNLGYKDDIVNVKKGYARNYLIPQGKAIIATESSKKVLAENLKQRAHKLEQIKATALALAEKMEGVSLTIGAKTSSTGTIFRVGYQHSDCRCLERKRVLMWREKAL